MNDEEAEKLPVQRYQYCLCVVPWYVSKGKVPYGEWSMTKELQTALYILTYLPRDRGFNFSLSILANFHKLCSSSIPVDSCWVCCCPGDH